jgi:hypothetical protein
MCTRPRATSTLAIASFVSTAVLSACFEQSAAPFQWAGPPFSADLTDLRAPSKPATRIYVGDGKLRVESLDPSGGGALVLDPSTTTVLVIDDKDRSYIDAGLFTPLVAVGLAPAMHLLRPTGSGDPCVAWNTTVDQFSSFAHRTRSEPPPHFTCRSLGLASLNGRPTHKWTVQANEGSVASTVWIDERLHVIAKSDDNGARMEMRNIHEGPQPAALFTAPAGYKRLGITEMLAALKNSHVVPSTAAGSIGAGTMDTVSAAGKAATEALEKMQKALRRP